MFALQYLSHDQVTDALAFYPPHAVAEPYRFLTAAFLHSTSFILHIAFNLYALWMVGPLPGAAARARPVRRALPAGSRRRLGRLLRAGVADVRRTGRPRRLGASGAVFGLFGAWFVVNRRLGRDVTGIVALVLINGALGFLPGIAWQAHLGGLVTGLLIAAVFAYLPRDRPALRWSALAAVAVVLLVVVARPRTDAPRGCPGGAVTLHTVDRRCG